MADEGTPRRAVESDPVRNLAAQIARIRKDLDALARGSDLRNASISGGDGLFVYDSEDVLRLKIDPSGAIVAYGADGSETARYGLLEHSDAGEYGLEVYADGAWVHVGNESVAWANVAGKPTSFNPSSHEHPGTQITSQVASAANATNAVHADQADGSQYGFANNVAGSEFYALWVGNDGGFHFGRNTSSIKYKQNVRPVTDPDPRRILNLEPVLYDRKETLEVLPDGVEGPRRVFPGRRDEYGMIAEDTLDHVPEIITYYGGEIDGIRYELLPVAMIPLLKQQQDEIDALKQAVRELGGTI